MANNQSNQAMKKPKWLVPCCGTLLVLLIFSIPYLLIAIPTATFSITGGTEKAIMHGWPAVHCIQLETDDFVPDMQEHLANQGLINRNKS